MNNDFDSKFGGRSSSDFERKTSSGFASGSFDSGFGSDDSYGSTGSMSFNDNGNDSSSQSGFGGSTYNPEPEYDPNAPLYDPSLDNYDQNAPLYNPSSDFSSQVFSSQGFSSQGFSSQGFSSQGFSSQGFSSVDTVTIQRPKSKKKFIIIISISLAAAVIFGIALYNIVFAKQSVREFLDTADGKKAVLAFQLQLKFSNEFSSGDVYAEGDDTMVFEVIFKDAYVNQSKLDELDRNIEAQRDSLKRSIQTIMDEKKVREFSVIYRYKDGSGNVVREYTVSLDD